MTQTIKDQVFQKFFTFSLVVMLLLFIMPTGICAGILMGLIIGYRECRQHMNGKYAYDSVFKYSVIIIIFGIIGAIVGGIALIGFTGPFTIGFTIG